MVYGVWSSAAQDRTLVTTSEMYFVTKQNARPFPAGVSCYKNWVVLERLIYSYYAQ